MKKLYIFFLITLSGSNLDILAQNRQNEQSYSEFIDKDIYKKRKQLKHYKKDLRKSKKDNSKSKRIAEDEDKIYEIRKELKDEEKTSNSFFLETPDMTETRTTLDVNHGQDVYNKRYNDVPLHPAEDAHEKINHYFRNH